MGSFSITHSETKLAKSQGDSCHITFVINKKWYCCAGDCALWETMMGVITDTFVEMGGDKTCNVIVYCDVNANISSL